LKGKVGVVACEKVGLKLGFEKEGEVFGWEVGVTESAIVVETLGEFCVFLTSDVWVCAWNLY